MPQPVMVSLKWDFDAPGEIEAMVKLMKPNSCNINQFKIKHTWITFQDDYRVQVKENLLSLAR